MRRLLPRNMSSTYAYVSFRQRTATCYWDFPGLPVVDDAWAVKQSLPTRRHRMTVGGTDWAFLGAYPEFSQRNPNQDCQIPTTSDLPPLEKHHCFSRPEDRVGEDNRDQCSRLNKRGWRGRLLEPSPSDVGTVKRNVFTVGRLDGPYSK